MTHSMIPFPTTTPLATFFSMGHEVRITPLGIIITFGAACCMKCQQRETTRGYPPHHLLYFSALHAVRSVNSEKRQELGYPPHRWLYSFRRCMLYEVSTARNDKRVPTTPLVIYLSTLHALRSVNRENRQELGYPPHRLLYSFRRCMLYEESTVTKDKRIPTTPLAIIITFGATCCTKCQLRNDKRVCGSALLRCLTFTHGDTRKIHRCQADPAVHVHFRPGLSFGHSIETKLPIKVSVTTAC